MKKFTEMVPGLLQMLCFMVKYTDDQTYHNLEIPVRQKML